MKFSFRKKLIFPIILLSVNCISLGVARAQEVNSSGGRGTVICYYDKNRSNTYNSGEDWERVSSSSACRAKNNNQWPWNKLWKVLY